MKNIYFLPGLIEGDVIMPEDESRHCLKVMRHKPGDTLFAVDGKGGFYTLEIISGDVKNCQVKILTAEPEWKKKPYRLHIAISPLKNTARYEWFLEKATEIGVDEITPILCHRTQRPKINHDRMKKIMISAMKQSMKSYLPKLHQPLSFDRFIREQDDNVSTKFIAYVDENNSHLKNNLEGSNFLVLIGPEGDFTEKEVIAANKMSYLSVSLGKNRLRTETAGLVVCQIFDLLKGNQ